MNSSSECNSDKFIEDVVVVTVTYGDRAVYLTKLIQRLFEIKISKIIIVDNNMSTNSRELLQGLFDLHSNAIEIVRLPRNSGSAKAFKAGLVKAQQSSRQNFILMLDDDNLPENNLYRGSESLLGFAKRQQ